MPATPSKIGMTPPHPGAFIRDEILDELGLSVGAAAEALGVRRATLSDLINGESLRREHGDVASDAGLA
jgi:antitoxin HigA-1